METNRKKICKAVHQYSKGKISAEDMDRLLEIAHNCMTVSNNVYQRYGGIKSLSKLYPGYTVQNEMTASGLREQLNLPTVYFYPAVSNALKDIKTQWAQVKKELYAAINRNERFAPEDKHYLRFVVKVDGCFEAILNGKQMAVPKEMLPKYETILSELKGEAREHVKKLNRYLCRQVRKKLKKLHTDKYLYFSVREQGYRYGETKDHDGKLCHGIFLTTKEHRKRVFIPLTDSNQHQGTLDIRLKPEQNSVEIIASVFAAVKKHKEYTNEIGISLGLWDMITTNTGHVYGSAFGNMQKELSEYTISEWRTYGKEKQVKRKKYVARREKMEASLKNYINRELNRMLAAEKPKTIYMAKLPRNPKMSAGRDFYLLRTWKKGYVTERLQWKCRQNAIEMIEVFGNGLSRECSACGAACVGQSAKEYERFQCPSCGYEEDRKVNAAKNVLHRGKTGRRIHTTFEEQNS